MLRKEEKPVINARKFNKIKCILSIVICLLVVLATTVALVLNISDFFDENMPEAGLGTLRMFTTLSNMLTAIAAFNCLPFKIDGLRRDRFELPEWIVVLMFVGATGTFLTFVIAGTLISIAAGFVTTMFIKSNILLHTINPILFTVLFTLVISDVKIKFSRTFFTLIPVFIYSVIYFIMVFVLGVWSDHYHVGSILPWPVAFLLIHAITFGLALLLRFLHNLSYDHNLKTIKRYYLESTDFDFPKLTNALEELAKIESEFYFKGDDVYIPVDTISYLSERYNSPLSLDIQYDIYLENYLKNIYSNKEE